MIDIHWLRTHSDLAKESQRKRGDDPGLIDEILASDQLRRHAINQADAIRAEHKAHSRSIGKADPADRPALIEKASQLLDTLKAHEQEEAKYNAQATAQLSQLANIVDEQAPAGGEEDFVTLKEVGTPGPNPHLGDKDHAVIATELGMLDTERGVKVGGTRFYFLKGYGALLEMALIQLGVQLAREHGFTVVVPPVLVKPEIMQGTGFLGQHASEVYHLPDDDLYLVGTSEVPLAGMHSQEIINLDDGPIRYAGVSTCFRREAGSYGKDTRGIIRVHQFNKLEMFIYCTPEQAAQQHAALLSLEESMLGALEVPYRVIDVAAGDLGSSASRKFDCEAWFPSQNTYRELTSTSNCTTFQSRRLGVRYKNEEKKNTYVATLNGTLATTRWIAALIENHYQADGSIKVPQKLINFLGTDRIV